MKIKLRTYIIHWFPLFCYRKLLFDSSVLRSF